MRYSKGKWRASTKDTWSVETTLNKIILAHLEKLYECLSKSEHAGVPMHYVHLQGALDGLTDTYEGDVDKAHLLRMKDLEELIWVFGSSEPDICDYDFSYNWDDAEETEDGNFRLNMQYTNEDESNRYTEDMRAYDSRKKAGYKLFAQCYEFLEW